MLWYLLYRNNFVISNNYGWFNYYCWVNNYCWVDYYIGFIFDNYFDICFVNIIFNYYYGVNNVSSYYVRVYVIISNNYNNFCKFFFCYV